MKIVVVTSRFPFPLDKGDKLRAYHQLFQLSKENEIHLIAVSDRKVEVNQIDELKKFCKSVRVFQLKKWKIAINLFLGIFSNKPFQVKYFYQRSIHIKIRARIKTLQPDHIYCQLIRCVSYVKSEHKYKKTLDYMDAFSKGIERRTKYSGIKKPLFKIEAFRLVRYENLAFEFFDKHCIISEQDRAFIFHEKKQNIHIISNGIDSTYFKPIPTPKKYDLVFVGNLSYAPNIAAAKYIVEELLPELESVHPNIKILICGANPTHQVKKLKNKHTEVKGWIADIREAYLCSKIFIAPMEIGTGLQNKLLEAMSLELPCITSKLVNTALMAKSGEHLLVANNKEDYIKCINQLIESDELRSTIGKRARSFVIEKFNWETSSKKLNEIMRST